MSKRLSTLFLLLNFFFLLFLDIPNLSLCQLSPKDRVINKYINKKEEFGNDVKT